jgi:hypothetical protein
VRGTVCTPASAHKSVSRLARQPRRGLATPDDAHVRHPFARQACQWVKAWARSLGVCLQTHPIADRFMMER